MRRLAIPLLLISLAGLAGCRVVRYPPERVIPRPIPDPPPELVAEITGEQEEIAQEAQRERAVDESLRDAVVKVVEIGRKLVGSKAVVIEGRSHRSDCSGFVQACFDHAGVRLIGAGDEGTSGTQILYNALDRAGGIHTGEIPEAGDLVFFSNTYDRNGNGRVDDEYTHVGFVESVAADGTVHFLHFVSGAVRIGRMNLLHPNQRVDEETGSIWNDPLRRRRKNDGSKVRYLTSQLWIGFGRVGSHGD